MREILFRGKTFDNEWVYGYYVPACFGRFPCRPAIVPEPNGTWKPIEVELETVGQYTGLTDKNDKKIFEGDIIKIFPDCDYLDDFNISKIYSYNGVFCVDYHGDDFDSTALGFLEDYNPDVDYEVIGNIYDNPELLEVGK